MRHGPAILIVHETYILTSPQSLAGARPATPRTLYTTRKRFCSGSIPLSVNGFQRPFTDITSIVSSTIYWLGVQHADLFAGIRLGGACGLLVFRFSISISFFFYLSFASILS